MNDDIKVVMVIKELMKNVELPGVFFTVCRLVIKNKYFDPHEFFNKMLD